MTGDIPNPYKHAVSEALPKVRQDVHGATIALNAAKAAFASGAWTGGTSAAFGTDLQGRDKSVKNAAQACLTEVEAIHRAEPDKVEPTAWQLHWRQRGRIQ